MAGQLESKRGPRDYHKIFARGIMALNFGIGHTIDDIHQRTRESRR